MRSVENKCLVRSNINEGKNVPIKLLAVTATTNFKCDTIDEDHIANANQLLFNMLLKSEYLHGTLLASHNGADGLSGDKALILS